MALYMSNTTISFHGIVYVQYDYKFPVSPVRLGQFFEALQHVIGDSSSKTYDEVNFTRFECSFTSSPLVSSVVFKISDGVAAYFENNGIEPTTSDELFQLLEQLQVIFSTRFWCILVSSPLVSSVVLHLLHSFRV